MSDNKETVRQQYGAHAAAYVTSAVHAKGASLARLVELTRPRPEWRVLDVSTGGGHTALAFAPHVRSVIATDLTPEMLAAAEQHAREQGAGNIEYQVADAEELPFGEAEFDLVTNRIALHHYPEARTAIGEMTRVLKPGGLLALVDNVVPPDRPIAGAINAFEKLRDPSHHWCYPVVRLETYLNEAGLNVEHVETASKEIEFEPWAERMGAGPEKTEKLRSLLTEGPAGARAFLQPRGAGADLRFSLEEAILIARK
jgi:ubiquinone/menaquinone biosynthesis C-methylase UbiE